MLRLGLSLGAVQGPAVSLGSVLKLVTYRNSILTYRSDSLTYRG